MGQDPPSNPDETERGAPATYEAPKIETVLTPEDLEREVHYAGGTLSAPI